MSEPARDLADPFFPQAIAWEDGYGVIHYSLDRAQGGAQGPASWTSEHDCNPVCGCHLASRCLMGNELPGRCELDRWGEGPCGARASWLVSVGTRKSDAQLSCCRHLNRTCEAMRGAENRAGTVLHVVPLDAADLSLLRPAS